MEPAAEDVHVGRMLRAHLKQGRGPRLAVIAMACVCASCADEPPLDVTSGRYIDASGAEVIVSPGLPPSHNLGPPHLLETTEDTASLPLHQVYGLTLHAGRILVAEGSTNQVLALARDGSLLWRIGGAGRGPEEFGIPSFIQVLPGDTIAVIDTGRNRVTYWTSGGRFLNGVTPSPLTSPSTEEVLFRLPAVPVGVLADRSIVFHGPEDAPRLGEPGMRRMRTRVAVLAPPGDSLEHAFHLDGADIYELRTPGPMAGLLPPMSRSTGLFVARSGIARVNPDGYEVALLDPDGSVRLRLVAEAPRMPVTPAVKEAYATDYEPWFAVSEELPYPDSIPVFDRGFQASDGAYWAHRFTWGETGEHWVRFTESGGAEGQYQFPPGFRLFDADSEAAVGIAVDSLGVERIGMIPIGSTVH